MEEIMRKALKKFTIKPKVDLDRTDLQRTQRQPNMVGGTRFYGCDFPLFFRKRQREAHCHHD